MADPDAFLGEVHSRLLRVLEVPPFRFRETRRSDAAMYLRRCREFVGFSEAQIAAVERSLGVELPRMYRAFLTHMGVRCGGDLFCNLQRPVPGEERAYIARAKKILRGSGSELNLPASSVVVYLRDECVFGFIVANGGEDSSVLAFDEDRAEFYEEAPSFYELLSHSVSSIEEAHRRALEAGGWFLTISKHWGIRQEHPARASGIRPVDCADELID